MSILKTDLQYKVRHYKLSAFKEGQKVFLKSNPEHPMWVIGFDYEEKAVACGWLDNEGFVRTAFFKPQCIIGYEHACLLVFKGEYDICLN